MLSRFFIDRPIFATVLSVVITLIGLIAVLFWLPVAQYPRITPPGIAVTINYPGASAQVVADTVAAVIEQQVNGVEGMLYMSSQMGNDGSYTLTVTFDIGTDVNSALVMVQNRVALAMPQLPTQVQNQGITIRKKTPDILMMVNFYSPDDRYDDIYLSNFATIYVKDELLRVRGVSDINYMGQRDYSIRIWLDPQKMASRSITAMDVAAAIRSENEDAPAGQVGQMPSSRRHPFQIPIDTLGRLSEPEQFGSIIVKTGGPARLQEPATAIVRLSDVARIEMGAQNYNQSCALDGHASVGLSVYQLPGTNALEVAGRVYAKMKELKTRFPDGVDYKIAYDTTLYISESIAEVGWTLVDAVILVGIVVLFFLQDWRAMILPMIDVPVSLIGTFAVMAAMNFSLNNLTLFGLVLAIGIVVDDAIVVLENIERMIAKGFDARTATIKAMDEITGPILAITLALCSVFVPCCFLGGITGQFFRQFAVTIAVSTIISAVNALTMTPSRAVLIFKTEKGAHGHELKREALPWWFFGIVAGVLAVLYGPSYLPRALGQPASSQAEPAAETLKQLSWTAMALYFSAGALVGGPIGWLVIRPVNLVLGWLFRTFNRFFDAVTHAYGWTVGKLLKLALLVIMAYAGLVVLTYEVFRKAPTGFIPQQDQGRLIVNVQLPDSASLLRTKEAMKLVAQITHEDPGVAHTVTIAGLSFLLQGNASNFGSMFVVLKPFDQRRKPGLHADDIMARLIPEFKKRVKDAVVSVRNSSPIPGLGVAGGFKIMIEDRGGRGMTDLQTQTDRLIGTASKKRAGRVDLRASEAEARKASGRTGGQKASSSAAAVPKGQVPPKPQSERGLSDIAGLSDVQSGFRSNAPQIYLDIDRDKAVSMGVSFDDVNQTLSMFMGSLYVNSFNRFGRHWQVTVQAESYYRDRVEGLNLLQVRNKWGQMVPLGTLVSVNERKSGRGGPITVTRYNLYASSSITGNILPGFSSGDAIKAISETANEKLPISMSAEWTELMFVQIRAAQRNPALFIFALAVISVFLALAALYESWALPLAVILVVPMCLLCSVSGIQYTKRDVNIFVQIGLVVLVGLACKNAILIVEYAKQKRLEGWSRADATIEACRLRLRPILMTSVAFIIGVVPLAVAQGAGAEMRRSLGVAVFSGMLGVTVFGIFLTPVFFSVIQGLSETRMFTASATRWAASTALSGVTGAGLGYMLARVEVLPASWAVEVCGTIGALAALVVLGLHRMIRHHGSDQAPTALSTKAPNASGGVDEL